MQQHYLDYNATAPIRPEVIELMTRIMAATGNASSLHRFGRHARAHIEKARRQVALLVGATPQQVIFTGSGTEANNQAICSFPNLPFYPSAIEHDAVLKARKPTGLLPVNKNGQLDLEHLPELGGTLVAVMLANNETGVLQPLGNIAQRAKHFHLDAVQAAGKIPVDMQELQADSLALSAHKIGGPQGVGALVLREGLEVSSFIKGGSQERNKRAGTQNVSGIAGFGLAAELALASLQTEAKRQTVLRDALEEELIKRYPHVVIIGRDVPRLPNTTLACFKGEDAQILLMKYDLQGIALSSGSACSSGKVNKSHVLSAMGLDTDLINGAIRFSLGWNTTALPEAL